MSGTVPVAHLTNNDGCSDCDKDRPTTTRPAPADGLTTVKTDTRARSCDTGTCSRGNTQTEHAQWRESESENLSVVRKPEDCFISSDCDSGIESALSSPTEITNQSPSDFDRRVTPTKSIAPDLEANIYSFSPALSLTEASQIAPDSSSPLVEASYTCYERATPSSPQPTKSVHFATPLATEVVFFPTGASEESKPRTANAAPPKTVRYCAPFVAEATHSAPDAVIAGAVDFTPLPYSQSSYASQWEVENSTNTEMPSTGSVNSPLPSLLGDDREEHETYKENTPSPVTAATVPGAPNEPQVAQTSQQVSSYSYDENDDLDFDGCDSDEDDEEEEEEEQRIAMLFMNFSYRDENKEKREKSTSRRKKKASLVATDEGFPAPAENNSPTDMAASFVSPSSLPLNGFNYTTTQVLLPPPPSQNAYVASAASTGVAVNMEPTYPDSNLPSTDKACTAYPLEQQNGFNYTTAQVPSPPPPPPTQNAYIASAASTGVAVNMESTYTDSKLPTTDKACTAYPLEQQNGYYTTAQVPSPPPTQNAYIASTASTGVAVNMESTYTDSKLPTTDKTVTTNKPSMLFVPDDGDLHVHDYAKRREERSSSLLRRIMKAGQPSRSLFSFKAFTVSIRSCLLFYNITVFMLVECKLNDFKFRVIFW